MKVMVLVKASKESEAGQMPSQEVLAEMGQFNESLADAGLMLAGEGLHPTSKAVRVKCAGKQRTVIDGPFAETKELIAGYWLWQVDSLEQAVDWVKKSPFQEGTLEIRPVFAPEDFGEAFTPELREQEAGVGRKAALQQTTVQPYLFFGGRCEEALEFYEQALGATIVMKMRFSESPEPMPEGMVPAGYDQKIMHAAFRVGQMTLMASDGCGDATNFAGFRLAASVPTVADCDRVFQALAEGGTIDMPLAETFWSPRYGQVTDKFGVGWMVMVSAEPA